MKSSHEGDRAVHEAPNANPTEIQSTSFAAAVLSDIADMDNAAFRQMLAKAKQLEKKKEKNREKNEAQAAARGGKPGAADAGGYRDRANERRKEAKPGLRRRPHAYGRARRRGIWGVGGSANS